ncbi:hypothetical protein [Ramlibacter sp.]|uniref:hypothetical protein n=1 Tax=Ramlibacter sp. TaxID=1917967 RepID=UPI002633EA61|nr:hypothetical protein [Ramlibacter sp.]MDB5954046.1 hypothetical protein [Ramlibacter sp.]
MCGLCGILAGELHWAERTAGAQAHVSPRAERLGRISYLNRLLKAYACTVADWHGTAYVLSTYTGKTEIASDLADLWHKVELLTGSSPDPLALHPAHESASTHHGNA